MVEKHFSLGAIIDTARTAPFPPGTMSCTTANPNPDAQHHPDARVVGGCSEGCCDDYKCPNCGAKWRVEYDG